MITIKKRKSKKYLENYTSRKKSVTDKMWSKVPVLMWSKNNTLRKCK